MNKKDNTNYRLRSVKRLSDDEPRGNYDGTLTADYQYVKVWVFFLNVLESKL